MIRLVGIRLVARARARANAVANALTLAHDLLSDLTLARSLLSDLGIAQEVEIARARNLARNLARANALARALANASALNLDHTLDLESALNRSRALARVCVHLTNARDAHAHLGNACDLAHALVCNLVDLDAAAHWARAVAGDARSAPGRVSRGLVALAVQMLPAARRPRYRAEFRAELVELPRRERLGYSLRVLGSAWELHRALVEAVCTPDGDAARRAAER